LSVLMTTRIGVCDVSDIYIDVRVVLASSKVANFTLISTLHVHSYDLRPPLCKRFAAACIISLHRFKDKVKAVCSF
jgi:hypothetical protein